MNFHFTQCCYSFCVHVDDLYFCHFCRTEKKKPLFTCKAIFVLWYLVTSHNAGLQGNIVQPSISGRLFRLSTDQNHPLSSSYCKWRYQMSKRFSDFIHCTNQLKYAYSLLSPSKKNENMDIFINTWNPQEEHIQERVSNAIWTLTGQAGLNPEA